MDHAHLVVDYGFLKANHPDAVGATSSGRFEADVRRMGRPRKQPDPSRREIASPERADHQGNSVVSRLSVPKMSTSVWISLRLETRGCVCARYLTHQSSPGDCA